MTTTVTTRPVQRWVSYSDAKRELGISHYTLKKLIHEQDLKVRGGIDARKKYLSYEQLLKAMQRLESPS